MTSFCIATLKFDEEAKKEGIVVCSFIPKETPPAQDVHLSSTLLGSTKGILHSNGSPVYSIETESR